MCPASVDSATRLAPDERERLLRVGRSRHTPHGVAIRAQLVADCSDVGVTEAARRSSVSRLTAAKWWRRYLAAGIDGLADAPRTGRPPAPEDVVHRIMGCALHEPPPGAKRWTTRSVAEVSGVSQATVSRIRRQLFRHAEPGEALLPDLSGSVVTYVDVHRSGCALGFHAAPRAPALSAPSRAARTAAVETIVCAPLLRRSLTGHDPTTAEGACGGTDALALLRRAAERLSPMPVTLVVDVVLDSAAQRWLSRHPEIRAYSVTGKRWFGMLHRIADAVDPRQLAELQEVQRLVRIARSEGAREFVWSRPFDASKAILDDRADGPGIEPPKGDLMDVVRGICMAISAGEMQAGEAISVRRIADQSRVPSGRVAYVLAQLAEEALIDKRSGRYRLPVPTPRDVVETYTARGLLGTAIVRRLASVRRALPVTVDEHYAGLVRCDQLGLVPEASAIDLDLQDELARAATMPRMGWMFVRLSLQLRIFVTIFGLSYRYPTDEILADDQRILLEIRRGDPAGAVEAWHSKIDNCGRFMLTHLSATE
ncbi:helix-turn-helix domain-containing protein [Terrabacter sp. GCM10028922]|uniref:helix-turn-helix domain-containing protein n=1 Tax=Terrabacter sp. GCM10028922 TaxID=3273428 RepID=UPI003614FD0A